jgi:murein DD-endopeptidase MepM/ murein hydrolase activator NlpD
VRPRTALIWLLGICALGIVGIALMVAYDDAGSAAGADVSGGPPHNPLPPPQLMPVFEAAAAAHHVPLSLLLAVAAEESGYRPDARSSAGALGVMQMLPATFAAYAPGGSQPADIWNPAVEVDAAAAMLGADGAASGDVDRALFAYNHDRAYVAEVRARQAAYQAWLDEGRPGPDAAIPWPLRAPVSQPFGCTGVGLAAPLGTPVVTACPGVVTLAQDAATGFGIHVVVSCDAPGVAYSTLYGHLSRRLVETGDRVAPGQLLGYSGSTGNSSGPHLHFEVDTDRGPVDPMRYLAAG